MLATLLLLATAPLGLELELGAGAAHTLETYYAGNYPLAAPLLHARLAIDIENRWSLGGSFLAVLGGEAPNTTGCCGSNSGNGAFQAVAAIASLRFHWPGKSQFWFEGGGGIGHLISLQTDNSFEHYPLRGRGGGVVEVAGGFRHFLTRGFAVGAQASWLMWTGVEQAQGACQTQSCSSVGPATTSSAILFLLTATFAPLR